MHEAKKLRLKEPRIINSTVVSNELLKNASCIVPIKYTPIPIGLNKF